MTAAGSWLIRGAQVLDVATGEATARDLAVAAGAVVPAQDARDAAVVDAAGLTVLFGLWDCHAHPGGMMYDPSAQGYFEGQAEWAVRAGSNLIEAARRALGARGAGVAIAATA